ncbi:MAG: guanylate kinase [Clostridia bacterium]|nr:guanylate kinase [Clostridia bacterium]
MTERVGLVFVISGPSGSGKGTVVNILREIYDDIGVSVSATSRSPRPGEVDGVNYHYKTREEFEALIAGNEVLEYTQYNGNYYGTLKSEADKITSSGKDLILEIEIDGGSQVKRLLGDKCINIMLTAPDAVELERRLRDRGTETEEAILGRLARAKEEIREGVKMDYLVVNETGKSRECAEKLLTIIKAEHMRAFRQKEYLEKNFPEN